MTATGATVRISSQALDAMRTGEPDPVVRDPYCPPDKVFLLNGDEMDQWPLEPWEDGE